MVKISTAEALEKLNNHDKEFITLFSHGSLEAEIYKPDKIDKQHPHTRDELYIIISGTGEFYCDTKTTSFQPGDFFFVAAGIEHRFLNFTNDFSTWVFFYGPAGGEGE